MLWSAVEKSFTVMPKGDLPTSVLPKSGSPGASGIPPSVVRRKMCSPGGIMSRSQESDRDKAATRRRATIASICGVVGAMTGVAALVVSIGVAGEPARSEQRLAEQRAEVTAEYVDALVGTSPEAMDRASSKATVDSDADNYAQFLRTVWVASKAYLPTSEFESGRATGKEESDEYEVCLPKTTILNLDCMTFSDFEFDESQSLLKSFTIDSLPVRSLLVGGNTSNGVTNDPSDLTYVAPIGSGSSGWLRSPDKSSLVLVLYIAQIWPPERSGSDLRTLYLSSAPVQIRDQSSNELASKALLPNSLGPYESSYMVFKVENPEAEYVRICGYLDGDAEHCWWIQALPPSTPR